MASGRGQDMGASGWEQEDGQGMLGLLGTYAWSTVATVARTLQEQPMLAAALAAAVGGAVAGVMLANRGRRRAPLERVQEYGERAAARAAARAPRMSGFFSRARDVQDLLGPVMALLSNPFVQAYLRRAAMRAVSSRFSRN